MKLAAKNPGNCNAPFSNYFWIPRSKLTPLGIPNVTCTSDCGTATINGANYPLDQINVDDGSDACGVCDCDLAYLSLARGAHLNGVRCGDTVHMSYAQTHPCSFYKTEAGCTSQPGAAW